MRLLIQKVKKAKVLVSGEVVGKINKGLLIFQGVEGFDNDDDINWLVNKVINLRVFNDLKDVKDHSIKDVNGEILVVSQFTLMASTKKGNRPSYIKAADQYFAEKMYNKFLKKLKDSLGKKIECGIFRASMEVDLINDGPVTIWIDSKNKQ